MTKISALHVMFYVYAALGLLGCAFYSFLPHSNAQESAPESSGLGPSRSTVYKLAALFSLDAFASGFVVQSLLALWLTGTTNRLPNGSSASRITISIRPPPNLYRGPYDSPDEKKYLDELNAVEKTLANDAQDAAGAARQDLRPLHHAAAPAAPSVDTRDRLAPAKGAV